MRSIYVNEISARADDDYSAFQFYTKSLKILAKGGFNLHKFVMNSMSLNRHAEQIEWLDPNIAEKDNSYTKEVLGSK